MLILAYKIYNREINHIRVKVESMSYFSVTYLQDFTLGQKTRLFFDFESKPWFTTADCTNDCEAICEVKVSYLSQSEQNVLHCSLIIIWVVAHSYLCKWSRVANLNTVLSFSPQIENLLFPNWTTRIGVVLSNLLLIKLKKLHSRPVCKCVCGGLFFWLHMIQFTKSL